MNHFFGRNLKILRREKMLSQTELGEQLNKGQKTIGNWETGYSEPCMDDLLRISEFFEVNIDCLLKQEIVKDKLKEVQNSHISKNPPAEKPPVITTDLKRVLQQNIYSKRTVAEEEIAWRDTYIIIMENRLSELTNHSISEDIIQDLMNRILNLQKMVSDLTNSVSVVKD